MQSGIQPQRRYGLICACLGAYLVLAAWPAAVLSQETDPLQEVVVTALKRETRAQETPVSMVVIDRETLENTRSDDFADFASLVPGLTATDIGPGAKRYALRGLQSPGEPEVALYYDEIPISGLPGASLDTGADEPDLKLWDVDRIEVLRGPQGTLYGNGSEAGAIRIISRRPNLSTFEGAAQVLGSLTDGGAPSGATNLMLNVPLVKDRLGVRVALYDRNVGGWIDTVGIPGTALTQFNRKDANYEKTKGGRVSLSYQVLDNWNITAIAYYQHLLAGSSFETYPGFVTGGNRYVMLPFVQTPWRDESRMINLISTTDLPWASWVVTGSYQRREVHQNVDNTVYFVSLYKCTIYTWNQTCFGQPSAPTNTSAFQSVSSWSSEARLVSRGEGRLQWTVGSQIQNAHTYRDGQVAGVDADGFIDYNPDGSAQRRVFARRNHDGFDQYSFFGNAAYRLIDRLTATVGLRWFHSDRTDSQLIVQQFFPGQPTGAEPFQEFKESDLFKSFELSYPLSPAALFYVQAAQGFRAGGPNYPGGFTATAPPYKADSVWDYELGSKIGLFGNRLLWNTALFEIRWSDLQVLLPQNLFSYIVNAGSARSDGFETQLSAQLTNHLALESGLTFNNARLAGPQPATTAASQLRSGDKLAGVPEWTGTLGLVYRRPIGSRYALTARAESVYQSGRSSIVPPQNSAYFVIGGYALLNLHLGVAREDGWETTLDIDNALNRFAALSVQTTDANLVETVTPARPLTATLGLKKRF